MVPDGVLEHLLDMDLDQFLLWVNVDRHQNRLKTIQYLRSETGMEALFVEGDFRYITYDMRSLENVSQSGVVGFDFWATPYIRNDELYFQNGHSNWHIHANRYFHSKVNGEIERSHIDPWPEGAEYSVVLVGDSSSFLLPMHGLQDNWNEPGIVHTLHHDESSWSTADWLLRCCAVSFFALVLPCFRAQFYAPAVPLNLNANQGCPGEPKFDDSSTLLTPRNPDLTTISHV